MRVCWHARACVSGHARASLTAQCGLCNYVAAQRSATRCNAVSHTLAHTARAHAHTRRSAAGEGATDESEESLVVSAVRMDEVACAHTHMHTGTHTGTHLSVSVTARACVHASEGACRCVHVRACMRDCIVYVCVHRAGDEQSWHCSFSGTHTRTYTHTHTCTYTDTHAHARAHTHLN